MDQIWKNFDKVMSDFDSAVKLHGIMGGSSESFVKTKDSEPNIAFKITTIRFSGDRWLMFRMLSKAALTALFKGKANVQIKRRVKPADSSAKR